MKNEYKHGIKNSAIIMGIQYEIMIDAPDKIMPYGADGGMDCTLKRIMIAKMKKTRDTVQDMDAYRKKVLRHEIIHAFLYESGIWGNSKRDEAWGVNEEMTDWMAIQFPKILEVFKDVGCL